MGDDLVECEECGAACHPRPDGSLRCGLHLTEGDPSVIRGRVAEPDSVPEVTPEVWGTRLQESVNAIRNMRDDKGQRVNERKPRRGRDRR
jgi:hypothetical protein